MSVDSHRRMECIAGAYVYGLATYLFQTRHQVSCLQRPSTVWNGRCHASPFLSCNGRGWSVETKWKSLVAENSCSACILLQDSGPRVFCLWQFVWQKPFCVTTTPEQQHTYQFSRRCHVAACVLLLSGEKKASKSRQKLFNDRFNPSLSYDRRSSFLPVCLKWKKRTENQIEKYILFIGHFRQLLLRFVA